MKTTIRTLCLIIIFLSFNLALKATHNRAGEITYTQIGPQTIRMIATTYTKTSSAAADRDSLEIFWGDGTSQWVVRANGKGTVLNNDVKKNEYIAEHTYPGRGRYTIVTTDPNRIGNILNVNYPNSIDIQFSLATTLTLLDLQFQGSNSSVQLLQSPIDFACLNRRFIHNPNAYDPDGDSLSYELTVPLESANKPVPNYVYPDRILPGPNNITFLDPRTGDFVWENPPQQGEYNIAIRINEYRQGVLINSTIRDMQILVRACDNQPPLINVASEICVVAGQKIIIPITISDPDTTQRVELTATGGPFILQNPAVLTGGNVYKNIPFQATIEWQTDCNHISGQYYKVVLRAADNFFSDTIGLATLKTILIKVVGPPPVEVDVVSDAGAAKILWKKPYQCEDARNDFFLGFSVWRSSTTSSNNLDSCTTGVDKAVFEKIVFITRQSENNRYFFRDINVERGRVYCYRVLAEFASYTSSGNAYNIIEGLQSEQRCFTLSKAIPFITNISVQSTSTIDGNIEVKYTKPDFSDLNITDFPGPYRLELRRRVVGSPTFDIVTGATKSFSDLSQITQTTHIDGGLNTEANQYEYNVTLVSSRGIVGVSANSTSLFLSIAPSEKRNVLSWKSQTAWRNRVYVIERKEAGQTNFRIIDSTSFTSYGDVELLNGVNYCYRITSNGSYAINGLPNPLFNLSQETCATPVDNLAPCAPRLVVGNPCGNITEADLRDLANVLTWSDPNASCRDIQPISSYKVYYSPDSTAASTLIATINGSQARTYIHSNIPTGLQGCYTVAALDDIGNESGRSNKICKENCPLYILPNTFTPNGDGANDLFVPIKNLFISRVDLKIFNEWGNQVFTTIDPNIGWTGQDVPTGVYYYTCRVFVKTLDGSETTDNKILRGNINLLR